VGLGGATTNIYSIYDGKFVRSVSANLGMSYSICNVLKEATMENIIRWIPFDISETEVLNQLRNKMIRPTTIPQTLQRLMIEHAVAREALRLGFKHHKSLARPLLGVRGGEIDVGKILEEGKKERTETYIEMLRVNAIGATGGLLSHAPRRVQCALILIDGFSAEGVVFLFVDSVFMMPHLGVMSTVHPKAALEIFERDCLIRLGTCIAFSGTSKEEGKKIGEVQITLPDGSEVAHEARYGSIKRIPLASMEKATVKIKPESGFDVGTGSGEAGIIIDARGRPLQLPKEDSRRKAKLREWFKDLDMYPNVDGIA
ncbi:MAG: glutamate mutase L, partial [Candidatus Bathyarchaeia archaeon]